MRIVCETSEKLAHWYYEMVTIMEKQCVVCEKKFEGHHNRKYCDGKECQAFKKEKARLQSLEYASRPENKAKRLERERREDVKAHRRKYNQRPEVKARIRKYHRSYHKRWRQENPEKCKEYSARWKKNNPEKLKQVQQRQKQKIRECPMRRLNNRVRSNIHNHLKRRGMSKGGKTFTLLGYTGRDLYNHLESKFTDGMSWDNMGEWHIDHIRPVSSFNFTSTECDEFKRCWALENLQPLWAIDNLRKSNKWSGEQ